MPAFPYFFFNDTASTEIYSLSLHDALPISTPLASLSLRPSMSHQGLLSSGAPAVVRRQPRRCHKSSSLQLVRQARFTRSEEHTSELQSPDHLVCRLLLEQKHQTQPQRHHQEKT